jgi:ABC-type branched-subunit amino acid transport system substrate-binding protein
VAGAFEAEVRRLGGQLVAAQTYGPEQTSFTKEVTAIAGKPFDALFVPDTAARLELIAPALAAGNLQALPPGARPPARGRKILLLSTAEAIGPRYLRGSGRYSHGALLAPGFYADRDDARTAQFVDRFKAAYGKEPSYLDAFAYDAALVVRAAVDGGARTRAQLSAAIAASSVVGLTGAIAFAPGGARADAGLVYAVERGPGGEFAIRAQR